MAVTEAERDRVRLLVMRDEANHVLAFSKDATRETLDSDTLRTHAIEMCFRIIGMAASRMSQNFQEVHPQIAWQQFINLSNHIIEEYRAVDLDRIWDVVQTAIPELIAELEKLLPPEEGGES